MLSFSFAWLPSLFICDGMIRCVFVWVFIFFFLFCSQCARIRTKMWIWRAHALSTSYLVSQQIFSMALASERDTNQPLVFQLSFSCAKYFKLKCVYVCLSSNKYSNLSFSVALILWLFVIRLSLSQNYSYVLVFQLKFQFIVWYFSVVKSFAVHATDQTSWTNRTCKNIK